MRTKLTSLIIVLSMILSIFAIYSVAGETESVSSTAVEYAKSYVHYRNTYGDSDDDVGGELTLVSAENSSFEIRSETNGNKYGYYNFNDSAKNVYMQLTPSMTYNIGPDMLGYMIFEMDFNDLGNKLSTTKFFDVHSGDGNFSPNGGRIAIDNVLNVGNDGTQNYFYFCKNTDKKIYIESNSWIHIRCEFSVLSSTATQYDLKCYIGDEYFEGVFDFGSPALIRYIRLGSTNSTNQIFGIDNLALYSGPKNISSCSDISKILTMKIGAENASINGTQTELTNPPILINGEIFCPVEAIEACVNAECPSEYIVSIEDAEYIHIDNVYSAFGISAKSYDMGLIQIGNEASLLSEDVTYTDIMSIMKTFVFNIPSATELIDSVKNNTNNYDHPYLLVNADRFADLKAIYTSGNSDQLSTYEDKLLYDYIQKYVSSASTYFTNYCNGSLNGTYNGLKTEKIPVNENYSKYSNNGYDNGGRVSIPTTPLPYFAFAYQMTGNLNYARAAYDYMLALGDWNHWGPDHFLNCADTAAPFAIAYDWLYDAFIELNKNGEISKYDDSVYDKTKLATILFTHVIIPGYVQSNDLTCPWPGTANSRYATKTSNWNAVCASGVIMAALMLLEEDVSTAGMTFNTQKKSNGVYTDVVTPIESIGNASIHVGLSTYSDYAAKLTSMNLGTLAKYGLDQYVPDGSYIESPGYWSYGTNSFFRLTASLLSAAGDDFGFMDAWGIDTTCYFAIHSESSDYQTWNFNDGSVSQQDSSFFFFVGGYYGDDNLIKVRKKHLSGGKSYSLYDILFYDTTITGEPELSTEYAMIGIDAFSVRSSWDRGAVYAGIIGGQNNCSHGQLDAGSFIYHNNGKIWFHDLGADNYNMSIGYFSNYKLYRVGAEGHNIISITSEQDTLPYGQLTTANPHITQTYSTKDGGYAVLDMSDSYGEHVESAKRGLLFTDSRSTVVIQDEIVFNGTKTAYWFGHYNMATGYVDDVVLSADKRTAFMISGDDMIRVSIVSDNQNLKFEIMDCYTYVLDITHRTDITTMGGSGTESSRDSLRKLAIKCEDVDTLNLAVVIEEVSGYEIGTDYEWLSISDWYVNSKENNEIDNKFKADFDPSCVTIGSYKLNSANEAYLLRSYESDGHYYLGIIPNASSSTDSDTSLTLYLRKNECLELAKSKYVTFDFDVFTENSFIDDAILGINVKKSDGTSSFVPILQFLDNDIIADSSAVDIQESWKHVTVIIDTNEGSAYLYCDNYFITMMSGIVGADSVAVNNFEIKLPASASTDFYSSILLDNLNVRAFSNDYDTDDLEYILSNNAAISSWNDVIQYQALSLPLAIADNVYLYSNADIETAIRNGYGITILRDTTGLINVSNAVTVDTQGYRFEYISGSYFPSSVGNLLTFNTGNITVRWHIDDSQIITETYNGADIATFKETSSKIGVITYKCTEYVNGGVGYEFFTTGWSGTKGGAPLSPDEMIVSMDNCDFWLVNNVPIDCLFVTISTSGTVTQYNSEEKLCELISSSTGENKIILCKDIEIKNNSKTVSLSKSGKTVYLNGYTLIHKQNDVHMFSYSETATGSFKFIGPGTLESNTSRTMFTSGGSDTSTTSKYGIIVENANIVTNNTLADLRAGQHCFVDCNIYQSNPGNKTLFSLWNKNDSDENGVDGTPSNLLTVTFDGCSIKSDNSANTSLFSYSSGSYSEIYFTKSVVITNGQLFSTTSASMKFNVSEGSSVIAGNCTSNTSISYSGVLFDNGVTTNLSIDVKYLPNGAILTSNYDAALPYRVSDSYAQVTWNNLDGDAICTEYVAVGVTPSISSTDVISYLKSKNGLYTYELEAIEDSSNVSLTPVLKSGVSIFQSMTIEEDLIMFLYVKKSEMDDKITSVKVDGVNIMPSSFETAELNGVTYYRYRISTFIPANACQTVSIVVEQTDGRLKEFSLSAVEYLESLLAITEDNNEKTLAVKLLRYIQSAYAYFNSNSTFEYQKISEIIEMYKEYDLVFGSLNDGSVATGVMKNSIKSVCYNLSASVRVRFYLNPDFNGNIEISLNGEANTYSAVNGKVNGISYIEIILPASMINENIILSNGAVAVSYSLNAYSAAMNNSDTKLQQLLVCLSEYSSAAKLYANK